MPFSPQSIDHTEARINTMRLQAAAPELLAALKEALQDLEQFKQADDVCEEHPLIKQCRAAIAKAEGK